MLRPRKLGFLLLGISAGCIHPLLSQGLISPGVAPASGRQGGPEVQIFTKDGTQAGISLWRVPIHTFVSVNGGYDDNVNGSEADAQGSLFANASIALEYSFGTPRTRATLRTGTGLTYNADLPENGYNPNVYLDLAVTHQVNLRLTLTGSIRLTYQSEPDFANDIGINRRAGNYFSTQDNISASYQWLPRISTVTSYSLSTIQYDQETVAGSQDRVDHQFGQSLRFLFLPVTNLVADYRLSLASYSNAERGSTSHSILGGVDQTFLPGLQGTIRAGAEFRSTVENGNESGFGISPHIEGTLNYVVGGKTSVNWTARYSTQESEVATSPGSLTFSTGLQLSHSFTGRISGSLSAFYSHAENEASTFFIVGNPAFSENTLDLSLSLSYAINRHFSVNVGYSRSQIDSEIPLRSYTRNRYFSGLSFNF